MTRPRILIAWEGGANFGHAAKIAMVAQALGDRSEITVAVRDPVMFRAIAPDLPVRVLPSPIPPHRPKEPRGWSYADNLRQLGYVSAEAIVALIESWRSIYDLVKPDVVIAEVAPTALLAAKGLGIKTLHMGIGFEMPPATDPMPPFLHWSGENTDLAAQGEARVLSYINAALPRFGCAPLPKVATVQDADAKALITYPELDHYPPSMRPSDQSYLGVLYSLNSGAATRWRGGGKQVFAYLRSGSPGVAATIEALGSLGSDFDIILASPDLDQETAARVTAQGVRHVDGAVRMEGLLDTCALGINHASIGTSAAFVQAGIPQIGLPSQIEQMMLSHALGAAGIGVSVSGKATADQMRALILNVMDSDKMGTASRAVRNKYRHLTPSNIADQVATMALSLVDHP